MPAPPDAAPTPPALTRAELTPIVRRALAAPDAIVESWQATPLAHRVINAVTDGLHRVAGVATCGGERLPWSVVLKVLRATDEPGDFAPSAAPRHWNYWRREPLLYASGLLDRFPTGLAAPRYLGLDEPDAGGMRLWIEDIAGIPATAWSAARYLVAARRLGQWQGSYAGAAPLPEAPWLSEGWLRAWVPKAQDPSFALALDPAAWAHPLLPGAIPPGASEAVAALRRDRDALLAAIDRLPQALCHRDLWANNLFARPLADGGEEIVLIDWSQSGNGALADDLANLAFDSAWMLALDTADFPALAGGLIDEYCLGLRDAGWRGDEGVVRATYAAIAALRFGLLLGRVVAFARDEARHALWAGRYGLPVATIVARRLAVATHALLGR